ncbi:multidrug efflux SMR transporter [Paenibacillus lautus]|uniref:DMT family transporter n=1 Tax=Paenibacillus lautus TaxID=1401 RepID=UPI002DBE4458|nr:multidrug efflux SMR transporter [Paenibacillus lautus]MEC0204248.1 multidrug efflux SMR transporter [Paenibacillus lautus]
MHWLYLSLAILFEVAGTLNMKLSEGFSKPLPSVLLVVFYICSLSFLTLSLKQIEISVAYAIWSGLGIMIITVIGYMFFAEQINGLKVFSILLIIAGVVLLNLSGNAHAQEQPKTHQSGH